MNNSRRKSLHEILSELETLYDCLEEVKAEEEDAFDNISESFEGTERYELAELVVENLGNALDGLDEVLESLREVLE